MIQHQKMAPGPPRATAVETPIIFPVPRVAARVVESAEKGERFGGKQGEADRPKKVSLGKAQLTGEINMRAHKQEYQGKTP